MLGEMRQAGRNYSSTRFPIGPCCGLLLAGAMGSCWVGSLLWPPFIDMICNGYEASRLKGPNWGPMLWDLHKKPSSCRDSKKNPQGTLEGFTGTFWVRRGYGRTNVCAI